VDPPWISLRARSSDFRQYDTVEHHQVTGANDAGIVYQHCRCTLYAEGSTRAHVIFDRRHRGAVTEATIKRIQIPDTRLMRTGGPRN
jgi:hypothetical protein